MSITLNGISIAQPSATGLKEEIIQIHHDRATVNGTLRRFFYGKKYQVTMTWPFLNPSDYSTIISIITTGNTISYSNTLSGEVGGTLSFTGYPMHTIAEYIPGTSLLRNLTVTIQQA